MPAILFPYSASATLYFALIGSGTAAHSTAGSGSLVGTNIRVSKDGAAFATSTNTGTALPGLGFYSVVLTDTELAAKQILVDIAGSGATLGTLVEAQAFLVHTYGSASALYAFIGAGSAGTPLVNLVANQSTATIGTVAFVATGTITTLSNLASANLVQILGTAVVGTSGTLSNVGTITTPGSANLIQILGTAVVATAGTLTNVGTVGKALGTMDANVVLLNGTALAASLLARSAGVMASGSATGTITSTAFETDLTLTRNDRLNGRVVLFLSGTMQFEGGTIGDFRGSAVGTLAQITISTLSAVPADGVTYIIV